MMFDPRYETMPRQELEQLQLERLRTTVKRVYAKVPFYRRKLDQAGVSPEDIRSLADLKRLPFTTKEDLRANYPYGMLATGMDEIVRIHASSGTTGQPTVVGYTANDISTWAGLVARALAAAGVETGDIIHNAYGYGLFTGGLGLHYGAEKLGAALIPVSGGNTRRQVVIMRDFGPTVLTATPSYSLHLAEVAGQMGVDFSALKFRVGIFGAEPWSESMRQQIEQRLNLQALDIYGLSEVMGPGVAVECREARDGLHIFEDHFLAEVIDPATGQVLEPGQEGELVFTSLTKEAFPLLRYRTRDITVLDPEPCPCGRTHVRMRRVTGRSDDMLIIRGVNVFPSQIESVLVDMEGLSPHYQLVVQRQGNLDTLTVKVEIDEQLFSDTVSRLQAVEKMVAHQIKELLGVTVKVQLVEPKTISRSQGKAVRVVDMRSQC